jgi:hypothetical protein
VHVTRALPVRGKVCSSAPVRPTRTGGRTQFCVPCARSYLAGAGWAKVMKCPAGSWTANSRMP